MNADTMMALWCTENDLYAPLKQRLIAPDEAEHTLFEWAMEAAEVGDQARSDRLMETWMSLSVH